MSAVIDGITQKGMFQELLKLLRKRCKERPLDYFLEDKDEGWVKITVVFRPKEIK